MTTSGLLLLTLALLIGCFLSSRLRWAALPVALCGLLLAPDRSERPDLLVYEDGKEVALIDAKHRLVSRRPRPNAFVHGQWQRAFPEGDASLDVPARKEQAFTCETLPSPAVEDDGSDAHASPPVTASQTRSASSRPKTPASEAAERRTRKTTFCRATTRTGLRIAWTDDYRQTGRACDEADIAIVARAIRLNACRSGAQLFTLKTLRRSGSVAVYRDAHHDRPRVAVAIGERVEEWSRHRLAPWPEYWRKPITPDPPPAAESEGVTARPGESEMTSED